jgi:hypothetical protein
MSVKIAAPIRACSGDEQQQDIGQCRDESQEKRERKLEEMEVSKSTVSFQSEPSASPVTIRGNAVPFRRA